MRLKYKRFATLESCARGLALASMLASSEMIQAQKADINPPLKLTKVKVDLHTYGYSDCLRLQAKIDGENCDLIVDMHYPFIALDNQWRNKIVSGGEFRVAFESPTGIEVADVVIGQFGKLNELLPKDVAGTLGMPMFEHLLLTSTSGDFAFVDTAPQSTKMKKFNLYRNSNGTLASQSIKIGDDWQNFFEIATSRPGAIYVDTKSFEELVSQTTIKVLTIGGTIMPEQEVKNRIGLAKRVIAFGVAFDDVPIIESDGCIVGLELLRRLDFVISFCDREIFVDKSIFTQTPFFLNATGLSILARDEQLFVDAVEDDSLAFHSGLLEGDRIESVNGEKVNRTSLTRLNVLLGEPYESTVLLQGTRTDGVFRCLLLKQNWKKMQ